MSRRFCPETGKARFPTKGSALRAAKSMQRRHRGEPSVYLCPHCSSWHLTHYDYRTCHDFTRRPKEQKDKDMRILIDTYFNDKVEVNVVQDREGDNCIGLSIADGVNNRVTALTYNQAQELVEALKIQIAKL